jgi:D-alanyl-lipoteichoic acid acyltransferase DltB (MBOAT superfamily)
MLFNSVIFLIYFLPALLVVKFFFSYIKKFNKILVFAIISLSIIFYLFAGFDQLFFLLFSIVYNYCFAIFIINFNYKKILFVISIISNLFFLCYFKYFNFFIENVNALFGFNINFLKIILPLGISFYTFEQISFLLSVYKNQIKKINLLNYIFFIIFFPRLICGPICYYSEISHQLKKISIINYRVISLGLLIFSLGLIKKIFVGDFFGLHVDSFYEKSVDSSYDNDLLHPLIIFFYFTFQIYFDFSAYSDMAIGLALLFNIRFPINFNSPLKSENIIEFWKNWHITLSRFIKSTLFIPLTNLFRNKFKIYKFSNSNFIFFFPLLISFGLSGLWHGANWTFIIWGLLNAFYIFCYQYIKNLQIYLPSLVKKFFVLTIVSFAFIFFRSPDLLFAVDFIKKIFINFTLLKNQLIHLTIIFTTCFFLFYSNNIYQITKYKNPKNIF